jgi:hypothetical protein
MSSSQLLSFACVALACAMSAAHAQSSMGVPGATFYMDQLSFEEALYDPALLAAEDFDEVPDLFEGCDEPVNNASNDHCFTPGQLIDGFDLTSTSGEGIVLIPAAFFGPNQASSVIGAIAFADSTFLTLDPPVTAVSTEVYGDLTGDGTTPDTVDIEVFDASGNSLGTTSVLPTAIDNAAFFGATSETPIARVVFTAREGGGELIDALRFGPATLPPEQIFCDGFDGSVCDAP